MPYYDFAWPRKIVNHLAEHDISPDDFERSLFKGATHIR
jgi:hypothetical protein